jgi:hypothetical protein
MKLPHYKNSVNSMEKREVVYTNLYEVILTPPASINDGIEFVLENVKSIGGLNTDIHLDASVQQTFKGADRSFLSAKPAQTFVDLTMNVQVNVNEDLTMIGYSLYRKWQSLGYNPRTGMMTSKKNYVGGPLSIYLHTKDYEVIRFWNFPTVFPYGNTTSGMEDLSYESGDNISEVTYQFRADYWDDIVR